MAPCVGVQYSTVQYYSLLRARVTKRTWRGRRQVWILPRQAIRIATFERTLHRGIGWQCRSPCAQALVKDLEGGRETVKHVPHIQQAGHIPCVQGLIKPVRLAKHP